MPGERVEMAETYPNLERGLKGIIVADYFIQLRRLDMWMWYFGIGGLIALWTPKAGWITLAVSLAALVLSHFVGGYRRKDFSVAALMVEGNKEALPRRMRSRLKRGKLQEQLSKEVLETLEECAKSCWESQVFFVEAKMHRIGVASSYVKAQEEASKTADALMRQAVFTVHRAYTFRTDPSEAEVRQLNDLRDDLKLLESESRSLSEMSEKAEDGHELRKSLAHIRALRAAVEEVESSSE